MKVIDIRLSLQFLEDWEKAPLGIRRRVDKFIYQILSTKKLPNSFNAHKANGLDLWIGYVNVHHNPYRILFRVLEDGTLYWDRLLSHSEMDEILR